MSTPDDDLMGAITPDELTIAWAATGTGGVTVYYADRASASAPFGTPGQAPASSGFYAASKVALSPDGLRLVVLPTTGKTLDALTRSVRTGAFSSTPAQGEMTDIDTNLLQGEAAYEVNDPVIGATDLHLYFSQSGSQLAGTLQESVRAGTGNWPIGTGHTEAALVMSAGSLRHPTGISSDELTLFYWDDTSSSEKAAWRSTAGATFGHFETLGATYQYAAPNSGCDKLYYSAAGDAGGLDLYVSTRQ